MRFFLQFPLQEPWVFLDCPASTNKTTFAKGSHASTTALLVRRTRTLPSLPAFHANSTTLPVPAAHALKRPLPRLKRAQRRIPHPPSRYARRSLRNAAARLLAQHSTAEARGTLVGSASLCGRNLRQPTTPRSTAAPTGAAGGVSPRATGETL
jgi:hypothetical protein